MNDLVEGSMADSDLDERVESALLDAAEHCGNDPNLQINAMARAAIAAVLDDLMCNKEMSMVDAGIRAKGTSVCDVFDAMLAAKRKELGL